MKKGKVSIFKAKEELANMEKYLVVGMDKKLVGEILLRKLKKVVGHIDRADKEGYFDESKDAVN